MSGKELRRAGILSRVESGELKLVHAAVMMGVSYRQSKRLGQQYREEGAEGLKHRSVGRESKHRSVGRESKHHLSPLLAVHLVPLARRRFATGFLACLLVFLVSFRSLAFHANLLGLNSTWPGPGGETYTISPSGSGP